MHPDVLNKRTILRVLILVTLVALGLRLWGLTRQALWVDEIFSLSYAHLWDSLTLEDLRVNLHGPIHAGLLHLWCRIFGPGELALRLPQVLVSAATVPVLFWAARPVFGDRRALVGTVLLAINPFHVWYSQEVRNYTFLIFFAVAGIAAIERLDRLNRLRAGIGMTVCWVAGLLCNLSMVFHIAAAGIWGLVRFRNRRRTLLALVGSGIVTVIALLPWEIEFYQRQVTQSHLLTLESVPSEARLRGNAAEPIFGIPYALYAFSAGFSLGPSQRELRRSRSIDTVRPYALPVAATAVFFGTLSLAGGIGWIRRGGRRRLWLLLLILPFVLAFLAAVRNVKVFNPRYVAVALPAYMMLLAEGSAVVRPRAIGASLLAGVVLLSGISLVQLQTVPRYWKADARSAARVLESELESGDLVFVVGIWNPIVRYYWRDLAEREDLANHHVPYRVGPEDQEQARRAIKAIRSAEQTFVLFYRDDFHDPERKWERFIEERFAIDRTWEFTGVRIWRLGEERRS